MSWSDVYLFCFLVGASLSLFSFLAGAVHLHLPFKMHLPFHGSGHAAGGVHHTGGLARGGAVRGGAARSGMHISWLNASTILAFLAWFGGTGYLLTKYSHVVSIFIVLLATLAGLAAGWMVLRFLLKLVGPSDEPLLSEDRRIVGALAKVSMTIRENGTGEIIFPLGGSRSCSGARSEDGGAIEKGAEVVIEKYEQGIAYVKRWDEFMKS
jgi:membrane protein implicated in regulation of membrane protease activity